MISLLFRLFFSFFKIGLVGFGGGYAMLSMILLESSQFGITFEQFADLTALDMIVPGPIAINAATYVGFLAGGLSGALSATIGVSLPSFIIVTVFLKVLAKYRMSSVLEGILTGVKPAAVGLIVSAAFTIASGVLLNTGASLSMFFSDPLGTVSLFLVAVFAAVAFANIKYKVNPILLTLIAGVLGAVFLR